MAMQTRKELEYAIEFTLFACPASVSRCIPVTGSKDDARRTRVITLNTTEMTREGVEMCPTGYVPEQKSVVERPRHDTGGASGENATEVAE